MQTLIDQILAAKEVSTPLVAVTTPDQPAVAAAIKEKVNSGTPIVSWDRARGFAALNKQGTEALGAICTAVPDLDADNLPAASAAPESAFRLAMHLPTRTILIAHSVDRVFRAHDPLESIQAVLNLRDAFKADGRMLVMLSPDFSWPAELRHDVISLDDPLPDNDGYETIIRAVCEAADIKVPAPAGLKQATLAVRGLSSFEADQILAMAYAMTPKRDHIDLTAAWELKKRAVAKVDGLTMTLDGPAKEDLKGLDQIIGELDSLWSGPCPPELVVRVDEIDKAFAGLGSKGGPGDNTGATQDLHQQFLVNMEDNGWDGALLMGIRGAGKTILTQCIGAAHGIPTIAMDPGRMKTGVLGGSERNYREAFRTFKSIGGSRVLVLATCNKLDVLPPELLRRFRMNTWFFDLPGDEERAALWRVYLKKYGHPLDSPLPEDAGWTGAEIRNCCEMAWKLGKSVKVYGTSSIVPVTKSDPDNVKALRSQAENKFLSTAYPGTYKIPQAAPIATTVKRQIGRKES